LAILSSPASQPTHPSGSVERIHYLDNVRAIAMLLGLVFHGGFTYAFPSQAIWIIADWNGSTVIDGLIWFLHLFRMATFFFIAGYFAKLLVERRGTRGFLWNRFVRIVCPFGLFYIPLIVGYVIAIVVAYAPANEFLPPMMVENKDRPPPNDASTMHMWFLYYLAIFSIVAAVFANFKIAVVDKLVDWFYGSFWPTLVTPLLLVPALYVSGSPTGQTESFVPKLWIFGYYGLIFAAGWKLWGREGYLDRVSRFVWLLVPVSAAMFAAFYYYMPNMLELRKLASVGGQQLESIPGQSVGLQIGMALISAYLTVILMLISLALGKQFLSGHSKSLRFISDASYWIYLVHLPLILLIQGLMVTQHWSVWIKFPLSVVLTFIISLGTYAVFVRYTPLGWLLNGYRPFPWHLFGMGKQPVGAKEGI
jgi:glucan biosynthesis protein C